MKKSFAVFAVLMWMLAGGTARAADTACARVSIEIQQELTLERVAFDAKLVIHNNLPDKDLENIRVDVTIQDKDGNVKNDAFFLKVSSLDNIDGVDGDGEVFRNTTSEAHWLIIPSPGAGGDDPAGVGYWVGATLTYTINGEQEILSINPDYITVRPTAQLYLDYFMPYAVLGDNPFTPQTEAPQPFPLAVRVLNDGFGAANKLKIDSAQPKIVDNQQGLLINFKLLGASVNDGAVSPSLTVDMGDVASKDAATAYWEMISTLSGRFVAFDATFSHSSELGGELTSLLKETNTHYLTHRVRVNLPGRDSQLDFLADTDGDSEHLPDAIFESEYPDGATDRAATVAPVTVVWPSAAPARPTTEKPEVAVALNLTGNPLGWIYTRMADPSQGLLKLEDVIRKDGVHLDPNNFWIDEGLDANYQTIYTLQYIDYRAAAGAPGTYTLVFTQPDEDVETPTTTLFYDGPAAGTGPVYITPQTRIVFTARDNEGGSGVDRMFRQLLGTNTSFIAAVPFSISEPGDYTLDYYSVDRVGNVEAQRSVNLIVDAGAPEITAFAVEPASFAPHAPAGVSAARSVEIILTATDGVATLPVTVEIFNGTSVIRTLTANATAGTELRLTWDGKNASGALVGEGEYRVRASVTDGLDNPLNPDAPTHSATAEAIVTAAGWFDGVAIDPVAGARQQNAAASGTGVVWQDDRDGQWDIYYKDVADLANASQRLTSAASDQTAPDIDGTLIVWQDQRNGTADIYGYDLASGQEMVIYSGAGEQTAPVVSGDWVAWQDTRNGNADIYAKNLVNDEIVQITSHERDQIRPALDGATLVWEDYRHGPAEIYSYDLLSRKETRLTIDLDAQFLPAVSGNVTVWTDQRDGQQEIYRPANGGAQRLTFGSGDRSQAAVEGGLLVYIDFSAGQDNPNLAFIDLNGGSGGALSTHAARQENPAIGQGVVLWQDDRDGTWQIYLANLEVRPLPITVNLKPGFNLIAAGQLLVDTYGTAKTLVAPGENAPAIEKILNYSAPHQRFFETEGGQDFALTTGTALMVYAEEAGTLEVAASGEEAGYNLLPGTNHIGLLKVPFGYRAYDLLKSVGLEKVQSVRRFDNETGLWQTAAIRDGEIVGDNFVVRSGDGLIVTMKVRVDGWRP
jgi:beta propeller repeat protein